MALANQLLLTDRTKDDSSNPHLLDANVNDCFADDDYIYIATDGGLSVLNRSSLSRAGYHQLDKKVTSVWASASYVYYATWGGGLYRVSKADINGDFSASATQFLHTGSTPSLPTDYLYKVRGHSDSAILIGHSKGVSFYNGSSVYSGYHLLADDFVDNDIGDDPAGWTVIENGTTDALIVAWPFDATEKGVKLQDNDTSAWLAINKAFSPKSKICVRFKVIFAQNDVQCRCPTIRSGSTDIIRFGVGYDGHWKRDAPSATNLTNDLQYESWREYDVILVIDCDTNTFDVYIDGIQYGVNEPFYESADTVDEIWFHTTTNEASTFYIHSVYITDATSDTFWGGPSKAVAITSSEIYYSTGSGVARKDSYPTADWEGAVDFHYDEDSTPGLITDLPGKFEVTDLAVAEDKSSQDSTANKLVVGQRNGVTVIDEHSTPSSGVSTHYGRSDLTTDRQDKLAGYSDVAGAVAIDSDGSYLYVGTREDEDPSDNFEGTKIDDLRWEKEEKNGATVSQSDKITLTTSTSSGSRAEINSKSSFLLDGEFDVSIDFENATSGNGTGSEEYVVLRIVQLSGAWQAFIRLASVSSQRKYQANIRDSSGWQTEVASSTVTDTQGKLRIVKIDEDSPNLHLYYWDDGWVELTPSSGRVKGPFYVKIYNGSSGTSISVDCKNFKINKGTVIWLNGKPKGAYTKIKLADNSVQEFIEGLDAKALCM